MTIEQLLINEGIKANNYQIDFVTSTEIKNHFYRDLKITEDDRIENEQLLKNITLYPHALVLSALMDRGVKAEHVWILPILIKKQIGNLDFLNLYENLTIDCCKEIIINKIHHRYGEQQAKYLRNAIDRIYNNYDSDISKIWNSSPSSSRVVSEFLQFDGCGIKIATMIPNILHRNFGIIFSDYAGIDISPDSQVTKILKRTGLVPSNLSDDLTKQLVIYKAKEINPEYPGIIDLACWQIGRDYCSETVDRSNCNKCPLGKLCKKVFQQ